MKKTFIAMTGTAMMLLAAAFAQSCATFQATLHGTYSDQNVHAQLLTHNRKRVTLEVRNKSGETLRLVPDESSVTAFKYNSLLAQEDTRIKNFGSSVPPITIPAGATVEKDFTADNAFHLDKTNGEWKTWEWVPKGASTFIFAYRKADEKGEIVIKPEWELEIFKKWESIKKSAASFFGKKTAEKKEQ
ncbi:hypothetical protein [Treponema endosymbiont of Eucomonympha sp.]|uniref:hypothetical protein n=1 Tax=Treponema endosymbiont of Eucomonympha sp. TaxID=1580831 RepID=UPI000AB1F4AC|nr:hypothetical protein [Treponema endosymbiont of Eucomonympha sp.]